MTARAPCSRSCGGLAARRFGRVALAGEPPARGRLIAGFWLDAQRAVWLRTANAADGERLTAEAGLQAELALPGVATVVEHGVALGMAYVAVHGPGRPLAHDDASGRDMPTALAVGAAVARVLRAVALVGVALPDAGAERFLHAPPLLVTLADLDGARRAEPAVGAAEHAALVAALARELLPAGVARECDDHLARGADLPRLIAWLERAALRADRD